MPKHISGLCVLSSASWFVNFYDAHEKAPIFDPKQTMLLNNNSNPYQKEAKYGTKTVNW